MSLVLTCYCGMRPPLSNTLVLACILLSIGFVDNKTWYKHLPQSGEQSLGLGCEPLDHLSILVWALVIHRHYLRLFPSDSLCHGPCVTQAESRRSSKVGFVVQ